jgi:hypothetical protein
VTSQRSQQCLARPPGPSLASVRGPAAKPATLSVTHVGSDHFGPMGRIAI